MGIRKLLLVFIPTLFMVGKSGQAQFINYTTKEGLSSNNIEHISEDDDGSIYISGYHGLNIFNGTDFTVYNQYNTEGFSNEISCALPLKKGFVLIGTLDKGLFLMDKYKQKIVPVNLSSIPSNSTIAISVLFLDRSNNVWIGLKDGRIITFSSSVVTKQTSSERTIISSLVTKTTMDIKTFVETDHSILAGGNESRITRIKKEAKNYIIDYPIELLEISQVSSMITLENSLYIGTNRGVFKLDTLTKIDHKVPVHIEASWKLNSSIIRSISIHHDNLWVGTEGDGLYKYTPRGKELEHFSYLENKRNAINSNYALYTLVDSNENLWVGTWFGGINLLNLNEKNYQFVYDSKSEINLFSNICLLYTSPSPRD